MATIIQRSSLRCVPPPAAGLQTTHRCSVCVSTTRGRFRPMHLHAEKKHTSGKDQSPERKEQLKKDAAEKHGVEPPPADGEGPPFIMEDLVKNEQSTEEGKEEKKDEQKPSSSSSSPSVGEAAGVEDIE